MVSRGLKSKRTIIIVTGAIVIGLILYYHFEINIPLKKHYTIGVILNNLELSKDDLKIIQVVIAKKVEQINQQGGIHGRELRVTYLDDKGDTAVAKRIVQKTIKDKNLIGYVGCWSSTRSKAISEVVGPARVPFIGGYALTPLFDKFPTMYTSELSIKDVEERFDLLIKSRFKRPAFIGKTGDLYSISLSSRLHKLKREIPGYSVVLEQWHDPDQLVSATLDSIALQLQKQNPDLIVLSFENEITSKVLTRIRRAGIDKPVFTALGDLGFVISHTDHKSAGELYDLNVVGIPGTFNLRLQEQIPTYLDHIRPTAGLELQLNFGARLADSIGLIAEAAKSGKDDSENIREKINAGLKKYMSGATIYRGWTNDWYFTENKAQAGDVLLAWKPANLKNPILAPEQYVRSNDTLRTVPVLYTNIDMDEINRVNDVEGSFYATFYLEITSANPVSIQQIDFTNAARSETNHEHLLNTKLIKTQYLEGEPKLYDYMYKVSGKFLFEPDLKKYPFDKQKFAIHFQPASATNPFLIQPSLTALSDSSFDVKGWKYDKQYVGYDHDIIMTIKTFTEQQQNIPFYKFSYTYVLSRTKADFFLKVFTPLLVILIVTYFSVFIPLRRFETLEAIQVTSLLASIALYFSAYKPEMEYATISDRLFIFTYIMITSLIGTSILRFIEQKDKSIKNKLAKLYQFYIYPAIVLIITAVMVTYN